MGQAEFHRSDGRHLAPTQAPPGWDLCLPCVTSLSRSYQTTISCSVCGFHWCWNKATDIPRRMSAEGPGCILPSKCVITLVSALGFLWVLFSALLCLLGVTLAEVASGHTMACKLWSDPQDSPCLFFSEPQFPLSASVWGQLGARDRVLQKAWLTEQMLRTCEAVSNQMEEWGATQWAESV